MGKKKALVAEAAANGNGNGAEKNGGSDGGGGGETTRYHLFMFLDGRDRTFGTMRWFLFKRIHDLLSQFVTTPPAFTEIDVWIESGGGHADVAYKLFLELQSKCGRLRGIVPDEAKSAATLLTLGMDEIYMAPAAELGPLDAQVGHPDREDVTVSALDIAYSLDFLSHYATSLVATDGPKMMEWTALPRIDVMREMMHFSAEVLRPAVEKIDPLFVHKARNELQVARRYAEMMLSERRVESDYDMDKKAIEKLARRLVEDYPAHNFVIHYAEAKGLGLPVFPAEQHPRWEVGKALHDNFFKSSGSMISIVPDAMIERMNDENQQS